MKQGEDLPEGTENTALKIGSEVHIVVGYESTKPKGQKNSDLGPFAEALLMDVDIQLSDAQIHMETVSYILQI